MNNNNNNSNNKNDNKIVNKNIFKYDEINNKPVLDCFKYLNKKFKKKYC